MDFINNLFQSSNEREIEKSRQTRHNERQVEQDLAIYDDQISKLTQERDNVWKQARELLKSGRQAEAQQKLIYYKKYNLLLMKLEKQKAYLTGQTIQLRTTGNAIETMVHICTFAAGQDFNPNGLSETIDEIQEINQDVDDVNKQMNDALEHDIANMKDSEEYGSIKCEDVDLMAVLEKECVAEITGKGPLSAPPDQPEDLELMKSTERLKKLLGGK